MYTVVLEMVDVGCRTLWIDTSSIFRFRRSKHNIPLAVKESEVGNVEGKSPLVLFPAGYPVMLFNHL